MIKRERFCVWKIPLIPFGGKKNTELLYEHLLLMKFVGLKYHQDLIQDIFELQHDCTRNSNEFDASFVNAIK